jgi:hypothetical protein
VIAVLVGGIIALIVGSFIPRVSGIYDRFMYSFLNLIPDEYNTSFLRLLLLFGAGTIKFFLAPFAWIMPREFDIHILLFPGQWFLYLIIFPFALRGLLESFKKDNKQVLVLILPVIFSLYLFLMVYEGNVPRQRLFLEALLICLAAYGMRQPPRMKFFISYYALFMAVIIIHLITIAIRYGTLMP